MIHTIISWDCCFRNFHHLIGAMAAQDFPKDQYEMILVEQRTRSASDHYNHRLDLPSLGDTVARYDSQFDVRVIYLNDTSRPYHLGVCNNAGIGEARGRYVSVMDGDTLVRKDFLHALTVAHEEYETIMNLHRVMAEEPVGVSREQWQQAIIDFDECLRVARDTPGRFGRIAKNKGPLISAPQSWWNAVGGYDPHPLWSTGVSRLGQDVTRRMEILTGRTSLALPEQLCVHPWHPSGFDRGNELEAFVLSIQWKLIAWSSKREEPTHGARLHHADRVFNRYRWVFDALHSGAVSYGVRARLWFLGRRRELLRRIARLKESYVPT